MEHPSGIGRSQPTEADEAFEAVRQSFLKRLAGDLARLTKLVKQLEESGRDCASALGDIASFAHRLRGAAAVFYELKLSDVARDVELAAMAASREDAPSRDGPIFSTLKALHASLENIANNAGSPQTQGQDIVQSASAA
jgi:HPt (histidine-containing phosphotransfer) domain-containing protein